MNGGRKKWLAEGRELTKETPAPPTVTYSAPAPGISIRSYLLQVREASAKDTHHMVDVRSPQEFTAEILAPPELPETCQRGGHIPGARNISRSQACNEDGTFKSAGELRSLYGAHGIDGTKPVIAYCHIGERSGHNWFVLQYLLGFPVKFPRATFFACGAPSA